MSLLVRYFEDAYQAWLVTTVSCCSKPTEEDEKAQLSRGPERPMTALFDSQPRLIPPPIPESQTPMHSRSSSHEWLIRTKSFATHVSTKSSFSIKRKLHMYNPYNPQARRPHIGAPMDFRHVEAGRQPKSRSFRPLELSIYENGNNLSPLMPGWEGEGRTMSLGALQRPPPPVHMRSESAMSMFTIPRKAVANGSVQSSPIRGPLLRSYTSPESLTTQKMIADLDLEKGLPAMPKAARLRANTMPVLIEQVERVKSAMQERAELVAQLESLNDLIAEKHSLYVQSRPGSLYPASEADAALPPLPKQASGIAKEVQRPKTAPSRPTVHIPHRSKSFDEASSAFSSATSSPPPPPPLPLFLSRQVALPINSQPAHPLRKKKSFSHSRVSRVSTWLFPGKDETQHQHRKSMSIDSITNTPRPLTAKEGFYQCVPPATHRPQHHRGESASTVQTISTLEGQEDFGGMTAATSFSSMATGEKCKGELGRTATFGQRLGQRVSKVGVAF